MNITIQRVEENNYIASFKSEILNSTFALCFKDNIFGAVALNHFTTMICKKYEDEDVKFLITGDRQEIQTKEIADVIYKNKEVPV